MVTPLYERVFVRSWSRTALLVAAQLQPRGRARASGPSGEVNFDAIASERHPFFTQTFSLNAPLSDSAVSTHGAMPWNVF